MAATGVGECDLHVFDQHGHPAIIQCKDVLHIPGVAKFLLSTYFLGKHGCQFVADAAKPEFPPCLHFPRASGKSDQFVALLQVSLREVTATQSSARHGQGGASTIPFHRFYCSGGAPHSRPSIGLLGMDLMPDPAQNHPVPCNSTEAQSPEFAPEWEPAMDSKIQGFLHHHGFDGVLQTSVFSQIMYERPTF